MKTLFWTIFLITINTANGAEIDITKMTLSEIKKYETTFLETLNEQKATKEEIQGKYLIAAKKFSEVEEHEKALYLLEKGFGISKPTVEYSYIYLNYLQSMNRGKEFVPTFEKSLMDLDDSTIEKLTDTERDLVTEHIVTYMRIKNVPSSKLPSNLKKIIEKSRIKDSLAWNDSIISARNGQFEKALEYIADIESIGEADSLYKSFLQAKLGKMPKYCLSIITFPQRLEGFYSKKICRLLTQEGKKPDLENKIRASGELLEFTPLYEALKK